MKNVKDKIKLNYVGDMPEVYYERNVSRYIVDKINKYVRMKFIRIYEVRKILLEDNVF